MPLCVNFDRCAAGATCLHVCVPATEPCWLRAAQAIARDYHYALQGSSALPTRRTRYVHDDLRRAAIDDRSRKRVRVNRTMARVPVVVENFELCGRSTRVHFGVWKRSWVF